MNITVIAYRKNKIKCSLGYLEDSHDSELLIRAFKHDDPAVDTFLEMTFLDDFRKAKEMPWRQPVQFIFLVDGILVVDEIMSRRISSAENVAEQMFRAEESAERRAQEAAKAARADHEAKAKRAKDMADFIRIVQSYSIEELRNEVAEFRV